jgi:hypothetical protein
MSNFIQQQNNFNEANVILDTSKEYALAFSVLDHLSLHSTNVYNEMINQIFQSMTTDIKLFTSALMRGPNYNLFNINYFTVKKDSLKENLDNLFKELGISIWFNLQHYGLFNNPYADLILTDINKDYIKVSVYV